MNVYVPLLHKAKADFQLCSDHGRAYKRTMPASTLLSGSLGLSWHAPRLPAPGADLSFSSLFITLDMHQWTWLSWLGIILQRNEFSLRVFVGYQNTPQYNMPATGGLVTTHHHTPNWSEIFPGPLQTPSAYLTCAHTFGTTFFFMCSFDLLCTKYDISFC